MNAEAEEIFACRLQTRIALESGFEIGAGGVRLAESEQRSAAILQMPGLPWSQSQRPSELP